MLQPFPKLIVYLTHILHVKNAKVYAAYGQIVVEGAEGNTVTLYDINGRVLATKRDEYAPLRFDAPASGAYLIRIGHSFQFFADVYIIT